MSARPVPETFHRQDWPRLVAYKTADQESRLKALERLSVRSITATTTITSSDVVIAADATAGAIVVNLPAAASSAGRVLYVKKTDASANTVTLEPNGAETIDGAANKAFAVQYQSYTVVCDGSQWLIV